MPFFRQRTLVTRYRGVRSVGTGDTDDFGRKVNPGKSGDSKGKPDINDPFFANVVMLLHFDEANGATTYVDSSKANWPPTNTVSASVTTTGPLFGTGSLSTTVGRVEALTPGNSYYDINTGDFTVELSWKSTDATATWVLFDFNGFGVGAFEIYQTANTYKFWNGSDRITGGTTAAGVKHQLAVSRVGGITRLFVNGIKVGVDYVDATNYVAGAVNIGGEQGGGSMSTGLIDEVRMTKGTGRYVNSYTPDLTAFPNK